MTQVAAIAAVLSEIFTLGYKVFALIKEARLKGWIKDGRSLGKQISEAKSDEERAELARRLYNHISH